MAMTYLLSGRYRIITTGKDSYVEFDLTKMSINLTDAVITFYAEDDALVAAIPRADFVQLVKANDPPSPIPIQETKEFLSGITPTPKEKAAQPRKGDIISHAGWNNGDPHVAGDYWVVINKTSVDPHLAVFDRGWSLLSDEGVKLRSVLCWKPLIVPDIPEDLEPFMEEK